MKKKINIRTLELIFWDISYEDILLRFLPPTCLLSFPTQPYAIGRSLQTLSNKTATNE